jgi:hypothetical protein
MRNHTLFLLVFALIVAFVYTGGPGAPNILALLGTLQGQLTAVQNQPGHPLHFQQQLAQFQIRLAPLFANPDMIKIRELNQQMTQACLSEQQRKAGKMDPNNIITIPNYFPNTLGYHRRRYNREYDYDNDFYDQQHDNYDRYNCGRRRRRYY